NGAVVSPDAGRRGAERRPGDKADLPHVQRLHDGPAERPQKWLLSARSLLRGTTRSAAVEGDQEGVAREGLKPETRNPSSERNPKSEFRNGATGLECFGIRFVGFGSSDISERRRKLTRIARIGANYF